MNSKFSAKVDSLDRVMSEPEDCDNKGCEQALYLIGIFISLCSLFIQLPFCSSQFHSMLQIINNLDHQPMLSSTFSIALLDPRP